MIDTDLSLRQLYVQLCVKLRELNKTKDDWVCRSCCKTLKQHLYEENRCSISSLSGRFTNGNFKLVEDIERALALIDALKELDV